MNTCGNCKWFGPETKDEFEWTGAYNICHEFGLCHHPIVDLLVLKTTTQQQRFNKFNLETDCFEVKDDFS